MYRAWCVATGGLIYYFMSGDNQQDFRKNNNSLQPLNPRADQDQITKAHFKDLSDEELDRQLGELKKKRNS